ncbi:hypothetical protein [Marinobacter oulmenensis]|uniref:Uncharacterized protein n=1 Tax=Marinobacter oulmenensis TaxID=643747 RepID=A0A840UNU0_9GAMM|nr:hypothetical protein [Marinobacter oulmenensis]
MKRTICTLVFLAMAGPIQATSFNDPEPKHYYFSYQTQQNRIVESSVCSRYSGMDWKGCRRYANWVFAKKC